jgi:hypothetical protein
LLTGNWFKSKYFDNTKQKSQVKSNCSTLAIIRNNVTQLADNENTPKEELKTLANQMDDLHNSLRIVSYLDNNTVKTFNSENKESSTLKQHIIHIAETGIETEMLTSGRILLANTVNSSIQAPYTFIDALRDCTFSMIIDGKVDQTSMLMRLSGFVEWLEINRADALKSENMDEMNYLFCWLIKSIQNCNGDVFAGLHKGLSMLNKNNVSGQFNFLFSDGNGVYAYTNINKDSKSVKKLFYKISRTVHNIGSYVVKNSSDSPGTGWNIVKEHNLYYFPTQGAMQVYSNIDSNQYDTKFKAGVNWVCLSLLSC